MFRARGTAPAMAKIAPRITTMIRITAVARSHRFSRKNTLLNGRIHAGASQTRAAEPDATTIGSSYFFAR